MALLNKLFFSSSNKRKAINSNQSQHYLSQFPFNTNQVRVLLYRECDNRGRRLLFDSSSIEKIDLKTCNPDKMKSSNVLIEGKTTTKRQQDYHQLLFNTKNSFIEFSDGFAYKHSRPNSSDITGIGEMIFGALAMSFRGTALKIHWLQSPVRILCSQVFLTPINSKFCHNKDSTDNMSTLYTTTTTTTPSSSPQTKTTTTTENYKISEDSCSSFNSISMPFSICVNKNLNLLSSDKDLTNPQMSLDNVQLYSTLSTEDSGINDQWTSSTDCQFSTSSLGSVFSDQDNLRKLSLDSAVMTNDSNKSSDVNLKRRISRNILTSFENRNSIGDFIGFIGDNYQTATNGGSDGCVSRYNHTINTQDSRSNPEMIRNRYISSGDSFLCGSTKNNRHNQMMIKRPKLGLAVCITMTEHFEKEMEQFCCEHIALFESMLCRLRASVENAYINHRNFLQIMVYAWQTAAKWIQDLFMAPRVHNPVWLNINGGDTKRNKNLSESFMKELTWLLSFADTKDTNFFISTMLTALLTYHLGWVSTITAFKSEQYSNFEDIINEKRSRMLEISQKHPYNALWAQMGDLYGSIGNPPRISRTIIYGTEKNIIERLLHVLTYFIRCEDVKKTTKIKIIDNKALLNAIQNRNQENIKKSAVNKKSGLTRSPTCFRNLLKTEKLQELNEQKDRDLGFNLEENLLNGLQNVKTENFKSADLKKPELLSHDKIRFTVTTPENIELPVNYLESESTNTLLGLGSSSTLNCDFDIKSDQEGKNITNSDNQEVFWDLGGNMKSNEGLKETQNSEEIIVEDKNLKIKSSNGLRKSTSMFQLPSQTQYQLLSSEDLKSETRTSLSNLEEKTNSGQTTATPFLNYHKNKSKSSEGVVFVLGDNEALVNIKKSNEDITTVTASAASLQTKKDNIDEILSSPTNFENQTIQKTKISSKLESLKVDEKQNKLLSVLPSTSSSSASASASASSSQSPSSCCCHHHNKKHSGVKFNFEKYPQIATNYMKNKNLDLSSYDFLDKTSKFDDYFKLEPSTSAFHLMTLPKSSSSSSSLTNEDISNEIEAKIPLAITPTVVNNTEEDNCEICKYCSSARIFQTPSNATELEFETEDDKFPMKLTEFTETEDSVNEGATEREKTEVETKDAKKCSNLSDFVEETEKLNKNIENDCDNEKNPLKGFIIPVPDITVEQQQKNTEIELVQLPLPGVEDNSSDDNITVEKKTTGFIPSLLVGVSDHYIPDMVLQGIMTPPSKWEITLKQDLVLSSHCATLMPTPVENIAIIADMSKWDVKIISSQNYGLPHGSNSGNPVGMSQLVSTMLETVHAMSCSGMSAYECLSYIESKLQEMYLQSETLAAFLLATEFCSLNTVTAALNLSENDVPLLLSVASVHSPQVTRKYGISFR